MSQDTMRVPCTACGHDEAHHQHRHNDSPAEGCTVAGCACRRYVHVPLPTALHTLTPDLRAEHRVDADGNPAGGQTTGRGFDIAWQNGALMDPTGERMEPTGAFVEHVLEAAIDRVQAYQQMAGGRFACRENALAITHMEEALHWLWARTRDREQRGVEGTHQR